MSGEKSLDEKKQQLDEILNKYENSLGLPQTYKTTTAEKYINLSYEDMIKMGAEDCGYGALILAQYAFFLQKSINKESAILNWADSQQKKFIYVEAKQYQAYSADERKYKVIKDNDYALKLEQLKVQCQARIDRINYLASKAEKIADKYSELHRKKK